MNTHKPLALQALEQMKGDDLYRAKSAFAGMSDELMDSLYHQSGKTCRQIITEYEQHEARIQAAMEWVRRQED